MPEKQRETDPAWTQEAWARYAHLDGRLQHVRLDALPHVEHTLEQAKTEFLNHPVPRSRPARLANWWNGDRIERTWAWLEEAETQIVEHSDNRGLGIALAVATQRADDALDEKDPRRLALQQLTKATFRGEPGNSQAQQMIPTLVDALVASFAANNNYHRATRALRNRLVVMTIIAVIAATTLLIVQWRIPDVVVVTRPKDLNHISGWQLLLLVMVFGALGALLTTIKPISTLPPSYTPFNFPLQQAILKIVVGTLTATIGVIVLGRATSANGFNSLPALLGAAAAFGAAQQVVTRFLDDRALTLVKSNPTKRPED